MTGGKPLTEWSLRVLIAERFGVLPFDEQLTRDLNNPYRRAFYKALIATDSEQKQLLRELAELLDVHGTYLFKVLGGKFPDGRQSMFTGKHSAKPGNRVMGSTRFRGKKVDILPVL